MSYRLLTYQVGKEGRAGILVGETVYDAAKLTGVAAYATVKGALRDWSRANRQFAQAAKKIAAGKSRAKGLPLKRVKLLAPVPDPGDIFCAGAITELEDLMKCHGFSPRSFIVGPGGLPMARSISATWSV